MIQKSHQCQPSMERSKGTLCDHFEFIGYRNGFPFAELLLYSNDLDSFRDCLAEWEESHWHKYDQWFVLKPGDSRPHDVVETHETLIDWFSRSDVEDFLHVAVMAIDIERMTDGAFRSMYGHDKPTLTANAAPFANSHCTCSA